MPGSGDVGGPAALNRTLLAHLPDLAVFVFDQELCILLAEGDLWRRVPWLEATLYVGRRLEDLRGEVPQDVIDRLLSEHRATLADGRRRDFTVSAGGFTFEISSTFAEGPGGEPRVVEVVRDVTAVVEAAAERERAAELHRMLAGSIPGTGVGLVGEDLRWRSLEGEHVLRSLGVQREQVIGKVVGEVHGTLGAAAQPFIVDALAGGGGSFCWSSPEGRSYEVQVVPVGAGGHRLAMVCVSDLTEERRLEGERRRLEQRLAHQERLDSMGLLASGVAHDFNNMLAVIFSHAEVLQEMLRGTPGEEHASEVAQAAERASQLTRQLLVFARGEASSPRLVPVDDLLEGVARMVERMLGSAHRLAVDLRSAPHVVEVDPVQLEQAVVNLVLNARDATPGGGEISVSTRITELVDPDVGVPAGRYVSLTVADQGVGMPEEVLHRAFDPFFTTKSGSGGSGLGLSTSYGAVARAGGTIRLRSQAGLGTTAEVLLPVADASEPVARTAPRVLVVDDEEALLRLVARTLAADDLDVVACASAEEALAEAEREPVDLLLTDVVMPGSSGVELARTLRERCPALPVVFITGYAPSPDGLTAGAPVLRKPFSREEVVAVVRRALGGRS